MSRFSKFVNTPWAMPWRVTCLPGSLMPPVSDRNCTALDESENLVENLPREHQRLARQHERLEVGHAGLEPVAQRHAGSRQVVPHDALEMRQEHIDRRDVVVGKNSSIALVMYGMRPPKKFVSVDRTPPAASSTPRHTMSRRPPQTPGSEGYQVPGAAATARPDSGRGLGGQLASASARYFSIRRMTSSICSARAISASG